MKRKLDKSTGFTLIELLVVIVIIGIIASMAMIGLNSARVKARDSRRVGDVRQLQSALELYFNEENKYPTAIIGGQPLVGENSRRTFMAKTPSNPVPRTDGGCEDVDYVYVSTGNSYVINFCLANSVGSVGGGYNFVTNAGFSSGTKVALLDGPIVGLDYTLSPSNATGTTEMDGYFNCPRNQSVTFNVGKAKVGSMNCANVKVDKKIFLPEIIGKQRNSVSNITTADSEVVALSKFLLSLDDDNDSTTIKISATKKNKVLTNTNSYGSLTQVDSGTLSAVLSGLTIMDDATAKDHLFNTYNKIGNSFNR